MAAVRHVAACAMANKNESSSTEIARLLAGGRESPASWLFDTLESILGFALNPNSVVLQA